MKPLKLTPAFKDYIWGGEKLKTQYGKNTDVSPLAESWELSCHKDGYSIISGGVYDGETLDSVIKKNPKILGSYCHNNELPILIKLIDAADNLSVQVHPNDEHAKEWEGQNGKTEMWYVVDSDEDAKITFGLTRDITKEQLELSIKENKVETLLNSVPSHKGDVFFVNAGTIHAIGKGNLIAEIQQNSNVTYRLYDYGRKGKDGKERELHIEKGVKASNCKRVNTKKIPLCSDDTRLLGSCEYFAVKEIILNGFKILVADEKSYHAILVTEGIVKLDSIEFSQKINTGETVFIPAALGEYKLTGQATVLHIQNPPHYYVGIDLDGTNIVTTVVDEYGVIYARSCQKINAPRNYQSILDDMAECAINSAEESGISFDEIKAVGIGCHGAIDFSNGINEFSINHDFDNVPIVEYIESKLSKKVYLGNDVAVPWCLRKRY